MIIYTCRRIHLFGKANKMTITERIFFLINSRGMSQNAFGKAAGIAPSTISDWKSKKHNPSSDKIMDICRVLEVTPEQLLTGDGIDDAGEDALEVRVDYRAKVLTSEFNKLGDESRKRLLAYAKKLNELEKMEEL